jgi:hypothetical protein
MEARHMQYFRMKLWRRIIAVLEMVGGVAGALLFIWRLTESPLSVGTLILALIALAIYVLSTVAGIALWRGRRFGHTASLIVQAIQIPKILSPVIVWTFSLGFDAFLYVVQMNNGIKYGIEFKVLAFHQLFLNYTGAPFGFGLSLTALTCLMVLIYDRHGIERVNAQGALEARAGCTQ